MNEPARKITLTFKPSTRAGADERHQARIRERRDLRHARHDRARSAGCEGNKTSGCSRRDVPATHLQRRRSRPCKPLAVPSIHTVSRLLRSVMFTDHKSHVIAGRCSDITSVRPGESAHRTHSFASKSTLVSQLDPRIEVFRRNEDGKSWTLQHSPKRRRARSLRRSVRFSQSTGCTRTRLSPLLAFTHSRCVILRCSA
jgi:hypothetical protein